MGVRARCWASSMAGPAVGAIMLTRFIWLYLRTTGPWRHGSFGVCRYGRRREQSSPCPLRNDPSIGPIGLMARPCTRRDAMNRERCVRAGRRPLHALSGKQAVLEIHNFWTAKTPTARPAAGGHPPARHLVRAWRAGQTGSSCSAPDFRASDSRRRYISDATAQAPVAQPDRAQEF